jgi:lysophospholipase L1-like esterase
MDDILPEKFDRRLRKHHLTIIMFGTNDSAIEEQTSKFQTSAYVPLDEYEKNMEIIINRAKKCSKHVIVMAPPAMDEQGRLKYQVEMYGDKAFARLDRSNEELQKYGMACKRACRKCVVPCEDMFVAFEHDTKGYFTDGIHFNARGQERVWERLKYRLTMEGILPEKMQLDYPMGIDLREKGPEWEQLFEKSRMENYKNRNGVMSFDDSPYNLGRGGAPSSSISPASTSTATNTGGAPSSITGDNGGKFGFIMSHLGKIAIGFVAGAVVGKALSSSSSTGEKVRVKEVKVEVPGKERIKIVKEIVKVPGPTRVVTRYEKVPGPEKIVYKDRVVKEKVEVPGKETVKVVYKDKPVEKIVYKEKIVKEKVEVPGKERVVTKEVKVPGPEKIVYKDRIVKEKVEVPGKERVVTKEVKVPGPEKIVYKDRIVKEKVEVPGKERVVTKEVKVPGPEKIVYKDRIVKEKVEVPGKERVVTKEVKVPGPEKIVYKDKIVEKIVYKTDNSKKNSNTSSAPPKEKIVYREKPVEKIVYKDKIVEKKVQVPGPERIVYKDKPVEKIVYKDKIVEKKVEVPVIKEKIVEKVVYKEKSGGSRGGPRLPEGAPKVTIKVGNTVGFFYDIKK